jgi:CubicO group peptidase (beta-lactamase class C family)
MIDQDKKEKIARFIQYGLKKGVFPGANLTVVNDKRVLYQDSFGFAQLKPFKDRMKKETIFDLASLTKVMATTIAVMQLIEKRKINLWNYIKYFYPELPSGKKR